MSLARRAVCLSSPRGFTLLELLIAIGLVTVLIALITPALSRTRESTSRLKCANNLKQIGIGMHAFHHDNKAFPVGTALKGYSDRAPESSIPVGLLNSGPYRPGAFAMILPYIGQEGLYGRLRMDLAIDEEPNREAGQEQVKLYLCPSAKHRYGLKKAPHSLPLSDPSLEFAVNDYNGLNGVARLWAGAPASGVLQNQGGFSERKALRLDDFTDGPSQTIYVSETVNFGRGVWVHGRPHYNHSSYAVNSTRGYNNAVNGIYPDGSSPSQANRGPGKGAGGTWGISSDHPGGANALFVDGSVQFLRDSLSPQSLTALATRNAGDGVPDGLR